MGDDGKHVESIDRELQAQLETELSFRRAERDAERTREKSTRAATRRFLIGVMLLLALLAGLGYLILVTVAGLFAPA